MAIFRSAYPTYILSWLHCCGSSADHSRGGKAAFALALGKVANVSTKLKFSALIGIDPVDDIDKGNQTPPPVLTPACHVVAKDYGHVGMLDDQTKGVQGKATYCLCKNGKSREPMRRFVGGIVVAFLETYLEENSSDLMAIKDGYVTLPVELQDVDLEVGNLFRGFVLRHGKLELCKTWEKESKLDEEELRGILRISLAFNMRE
ncbi:hypothetical protein RND71_022753 [Anisodus tanguticus]|uniref:Uncharacterized protein n=1 Tax=Anisodus tanguticus TaxID=243964 RepID=A0AAE1V5G4_9SOLA|nr:hypothetical protein RND71_022753 [Anisodus tanguticus]